MIWGKTQQERDIAAAAKRTAKFRKKTSGYYRFAWYPEYLSDGRWVWLEFVFWRLHYDGYEYIWKRSIEK